MTRNFLKRNLIDDSCNKSSNELSPTHGTLGQVSIVNLFAYFVHIMLSLSQSLQHFNGKIGSAAPPVPVVKNGSVESPQRAC